jgi:phosphotriesterase-related protein
MDNGHFGFGRIDRRAAMGLLLRGGVGCGVMGLLAERQVGAAHELFDWDPESLDFPHGSIIRTILKDVSPHDLKKGATWIHEHLNFAFMKGSPPVVDLDLVVNELQQSAEEGVIRVIDQAVNRRTDQQVQNLRTIAARTRVNIIMAGGYYTSPYPASANIPNRSVDDIANELVADAANQRWGALGEIGVSVPLVNDVAVQPDEIKVMQAVSKAQLRTGLPIFTHNPHQGCVVCPHLEIDTYLNAGVAPDRICIGHLTDIRASTDPGWQSLRALGQRGSFLGFDTLVQDYTRFSSRGFTVTPDAERVQMILAALDAGFEDQILFSTDFSNPPQLKTNQGAGFSSILDDFVPKLIHAGVDERTIRKIIIDNPRRLLAFVPKRPGRW